MAARRQSAWEAQLKEKAFFSATIRPIVDDTVTFKPLIPCALCEVKRSMDKGIHFRNNTYGVGGITGVAHVTALHEYDNWDQWAQLPAGNVAEHNEGLSMYVKSLTWNASILEFGTQDERNDGRAQETAALSFIHTETLGELDELRREAMMMSTEAFNALKQPAGRGGGGAAVRAEKPEKMTKVRNSQSRKLLVGFKRMMARGSRCLRKQPTVGIWTTMG